MSQGAPSPRHFPDRSGHLPGPAPRTCTGERPLTTGEIALARKVFGTAIDYGKVRIRRQKWFPFQPRSITMAPRGHIHFHPQSASYREDFSAAPLDHQALLIHELAHVWQAQTRGSWYLVVCRHPFCRYDYVLRPGWRFSRYGIEQQAMIVQHAFMLQSGRPVPGAPDLATYRRLIPFWPGKSGVLPDENTR